MFSFRTSTDRQIKHICRGDASQYQLKTCCTVDRVMEKQRREIRKFERKRTILKRKDVSDS